MRNLQKPVNALLIGAGNRGAEVYGRFALAHPWLIRFSAVADPNETRRTRFTREHGISEDRSYIDWEELLNAAEPEDLVFICTPDRLHYRQAMAFLDRGCSIVLEKPVAVTAQECRDIERGVSDRKRRAVVCHVLRYTPFFSTLKDLLDRGRIGKIISINLQENVGYYHFAHSYVRGNWRNSKEACPSLLAKSCHDLDLLYWLAGARAETVSSIGGLAWFKPENAPEGAPDRCMEGCPVRSSCPWFAPKLYLTAETGWPASVISDDTSLAARIHALEEGPYGRCVYRCDNDVADHQHVEVAFENGVTASFVLSAFTADISRGIQVTGSEGEIVGNLKEDWLELRDFRTGIRSRTRTNIGDTGHSGGDDALMYDIAAQFGAALPEWTSRSRLEESLEGHWMAFAAEAARTEGRIVRVQEYKTDMGKASNESI